MQTQNHITNKVISAEVFRTALECTKLEAADAAGGTGVAGESDWPCPALLPDAQILRQGVTNLIADSGHLIYSRKGGESPLARLKDVGMWPNLTCGVMAGASFREFPMR